MLQSLHIVNFAIIEDTVIDLTKGVTILRVRQERGSRS